MPSEQPGVPQPSTGVGRSGRHRPLPEQTPGADAGASPARHATPEPLGALPTPAPRPARAPQPFAQPFAQPDPGDRPTEPLDPVGRDGAARPPGTVGAHRTAAADDPSDDAPDGPSNGAEDTGARRTGRRRAVTGTGAHRPTAATSTTGTHRIRAAGRGHRGAPPVEDSGHYDAYNYDSEYGGMAAPPPAAPAPTRAPAPDPSPAAPSAATPAAIASAPPPEAPHAVETPAAERTGRRRARRPAPAGGHGHGHGHSPAAPSGRRVRILIAALLVPCGVAALVGLALLYPRGGPPAPPKALDQQPVNATVTQASPSDCTPGSGDRGCVTLLLAMADGPQPGRDLVQVVPAEPSTPTFAVGDRVVLGYSGGDANDPGSYQVVDFQRGQPLIWLAAAFAVAVLVLGRFRGLAALAALGLSFGVLLLFVLPAILAGSDPLAVAVVGSGLIMFAVLYLTHGFSARTSVAVLGTLVSLALIGGLGAGFAAAARLTGLDDQTANLIATLGTGVDARGLLLAGVVIGALGVLDDVTVTQTSAVWELRRANPALGPGALFGSAMRIGRDHVASAVNTLVLAYAGAALPLMLLFSLSGRGITDVLTTQEVATEIIRTLVGSIGLVASVPITTALAAVVAGREEVPAGAG
jgi:uncharacterized membrane protein